MFSIIIPLYNKETVIKKTIESVLAQSLQKFEIIVVNDGSTDNGAKLVENIQDERIRIVHQTNQGVSAARNTGIIESQYNWLALLDGDDEWEPSYLENIEVAIRKDPRCVAYCTNYRKLDLYGNSIDINWNYVPKKEGRLRNYYKASLFSAPIITSSSVCLNKSILKSEGLVRLFPIGVKSGEDLDSWVRLLRNQDLFIINKKLVKINVVQGGVEHIMGRLSAEVDYKRWFRYSCNSNSKKFWLSIYAIKKMYRVRKKGLFVSVPWLYKFYIRIRQYLSS